MDNALYKNDSDYARDYAVTLSHDDFMGTEKSLSGIPTTRRIIPNPLFESGFQRVPRFDPGYFEMTMLISSVESDLQGTSPIDYPFSPLCGKSLNR